MNHMDIVQMRQQKAEIVAKMNALNALIKKEQREFTIQESAQWEGMEQEVRRLEGQITRDELQEQRTGDMARSMDRGLAAVEYTSAILRPDQSVRSYMEHEGLIKQPEYSKLSFGAFCRAMVTGARNDLERRALGEGTDSAGGYGVPDLVLARFIDKMRAQQVCVRAGAQTVPLTSDRATIARTATDAAATWRVENAAINVADPTFEGVVFQPRSLAVIIRVSRELLDDSLNIEAMLEASFAGAMAVELDRVALVGSGISPEPLGIAGTGNVGSVTSAGTAADWDKYIDGLSALWTANENVCSAIVLHPRTLTTLSKMKTGLTSDKTSLQKPPVLADIPIMQTTSVPITLGSGSDSIVIMGNFARLMIGVRSSLRVEVLRELYAGSHQYGFAAHLRADIAIEHPESFCVLSGVTA
jgi:HK97 family phage major capsid protein